MPVKSHQMHIRGDKFEPAGSIKACHGPNLASMPRGESGSAVSASQHIGDDCISAADILP